MKFELFHTIKSFNEFKYKEKGSIFIGKAFPAENEKEVSAVLEEIKKKYYDATHHCYAYNLNNGEFKYSDAGEPSGTAGIRIYNAIKHFNLSNILVVVIRYFGGVKLGVGPLGKAYYQTALRVLENSNQIKKVPYKNVILKIDYSTSSIVYRILSQTESKIVETKTDDGLLIKCQIKFENIDTVKDQLINSVGGKIKIEEREIIFL